MPDVTIVYWRDIPAQVIVGSGRRGHKVQLPERFEQAIDRAAMKAGARDTDAYLAEWRKAPAYAVEGDPAEVAAAEAARIDAEYDAGRLRALIESHGLGAGARVRVRMKEALMSLIPFLRRAKPAPAASSAAVPAFLSGWSVEVMPRTAAKVPDFRAILPRGTRVYIAHIDGTEIADMVATARRLHEEGFDVMPHVPARSIPDRATLSDWIARYKGEADVRQALILAGGRKDPAGEFTSSMDLLGTGLFDGFERLHLAGHPEGNKDIDPDGSDRMVMELLRWKQAFAERTDAAVALATQFCFDAAPVLAWADRLRAEDIRLPIHIGIAGPAKLNTLIKFAIACGVGPSLQVLQKRALDVTKLLLPYEPDEVVEALAAAAHPGIEQVHLFPLGGIGTAAAWANGRTGQAPALAVNG